MNARVMLGWVDPADLADEAEDGEEEEALEEPRNTR
jgi:hypothetical protein